MTARDEFIQSLKADLQVRSEQPMSSLIDHFLMEGTSMQAPICNLALDEETERQKAKFREHSGKIEKIVKDLSQPLREAIECELNRMDDQMVYAVYQASNATFDILTEFFVGKTLVPFLRDLADQLEQRGGGE
ncbi:hypothetical protein MYX82_14675 [Acidobacteria bacterium AH-259-D05]|nr:hypothetical protein [Acidobacteria bacterium AH-259-D05]